jgi:hypothetical protein
MLEHSYCVCLWKITIHGPSCHNHLTHYNTVRLKLKVFNGFSLWKSYHNIEFNMSNELSLTCGNVRQIHEGLEKNCAFPPNHLKNVRVGQLDLFSFFQILIYCTCVVAKNFVARQLSFNLTSFRHNRAFISDLMKARDLQKMVFPNIFSWFHSSWSARQSPILMCVVVLVVQHQGFWNPKVA